jgi:hypothetical protein
LDDTSRVLVSVGASDLSVLNQLGFAATPATTRLALSGSTVSDMATNPVIGILPNASVLVSNFTPKAVEFPVVQEFVLDMNAGLINLTLSAPMNISVFNESRALLQSSLSNPTVRIPLVNTTLVPSSTPRTNVILLLSRVTLNNLKSSASIAKSIDSSVLFADLGMFSDTIGTPLNISLLTARLLISDTSAPNVTNFQFSMADPVTALLSFSEPMALSSFNASRVMFSKNASLAEAYTLVNSTVAPQQNDATSFLITLGSVDVLTLKALRICISQGACFISLQPGAFLDANNNSIDSSSLFLPASTVVPDITSPSLLSFALYDGNVGMLSLSFSEPIDIDSLNTSALQLSIGPAIYASTALYLTGGTVNSSRLFTLVSITLTSVDLNEIKSLLMCRAVLQCGLLLEVLFATDVSGNFLTPVGYEPPNPANNNQLPRALIVDTTPPRLTRFDLNMDSQLLTLTFDEPIRLSTFNMTNSLILQDASPAAINITLSAPETTRLTTQDISITIAIRIAGLDTTRLKARPIIAKAANTTFLTALGGLARDVATAPNVFRTVVGLPVSSFQADVTPPEFTAFSIFDATQGLIALQFSEPVNNVSVVNTRLALASQPVNGRNFTLTGARSNVYADDSTKTTVYLYMTPADLLNLRLTPGVAVSTSTSFAFVDFGFLEDTSGNAILASAARPVALYVPSTRPFVSQFSLNMATGVLSLTFNVVINASSVQPSEFTLQSDAQGSASSQSYTLTSSSVVNGTSGFSVDLLLGSIDLNSIKARRLLAKSAGSTFLSITADAFQDTSLPSQAAVAVGRTAALNVISYTADNISPQIIAFSFALDPCSLLLNFSEVVDLTTLNVSGLRLQLTSNSDSVSVMMSASSISPNNVGLFAELTVPTSVADDVKARNPLGVSIASTFLSASSVTVSDMAGVVLQPIPSASALQAVIVRLDSVAPTLVAFDVDMDAGTLLFTFSEYVNISTFVPSGLTLRNAALTVSITLDNSDTSIQRLSNTVSQVQIGLADLNRIRLLAKQALLVNRTSTLLNVNPGTVQDNAGNAQPAVISMVATNFAPDTTRPQLVSFDFDFSLNTVILSFSEVVDASTLVASTLEFQSSADRAQSQSVYRLTNSVVGFFVDGLRVVVNLSATDVSALRVAYPLCSTSATTFLVLQASTVRDMYGNLMLATSAASGFPVASYIPDLVGPSLVSFTINMATRLFVLNFDKPVNVSTFNALALVLQADQVLAPGRSFVLTGGVAMSVNPFQVVLNMSSADHASIRLIAGLYVSMTRSYASFSNNLVMSLSGLPVLPVSSSNAQRAAQFVGDSSQAQITSFNLDMTTNTLVLSFSAVVQASSFQISFLSLQSVLNATSSQQQVTLTSGLLLTSGMNSSVSISLNTSDVNIMKQRRICHTQSACWLTALDATAVDSFNVSSLGLLNGVGSIPVIVYVLDSVSPVLVAFDLDMNRSRVNLEFSETVWVVSLRTNLVSLSSSAILSGVPLTNTSHSSSPDGTSLAIDISSDDLNAVKATGLVALSRSKSFLSLASNAITDVSGNGIPAVSGFAVRDYAPDVNEPALMFFSVELDLTLDVVLTFNEVINVSTVDVTKLTLLPSNGPNNAFVVSSGSASSASPFSRVVRISLSPGDANVVKSLNPLFTTISSSFLSSAAGLIFDVFGNPSSAVLSNSPLQASSVTIGNVRPGLLSFALDLNSGLLSLTFSETVNASTLDTSRLAFIEAANGMIVVPLVRVSPPMGNGVVVNTSLTVDDLNALKLQLPNLGGSVGTTFLSTTEGVVLNMLGQSARARNSSDPAPCTRLVADVSLPIATNFSLDMSAGSLVVTFDEPVLAASVNELLFSLGEGPNAVVVGPFRSRSVTNGLSLTFNLTTSVLDNLKLARVGLSSSVSLSTLAGAVADISSNALAPTVSPLVARTFVADSISPRLLSFSLDMSTTLLALTFDEPMSAASFNRSCIQLQGLPVAVPGDPVIVPRLTRSALLNASDSSVLNVVLNTSDANNIKAIAAACKSANTTFLTMDSCFAMDMSGNAAEPQFPGLAVTSYTRDTVMPRFVSFSLDMNTGLLVLTFNEPMQRTSFNRSRVTLEGVAGSPQFALPP